MAGTFARSTSSRFRESVRHAGIRLEPDPTFPPGLREDRCEDRTDAAGAVEAGGTALALTDAELIERALAGEEDAFRVLVVRYERSVYNLLARMLRDPALAEDLAQETFVRAFRHLSTFDPRYKLSNWLLRIAHNAAIDAMRRRGPEWVSLEGGEEHRPIGDTLLAPGGEDGLRRVERRDLGAVLDAAVTRLRPEYRQLVVLRYHEERSYEEIAEITGLPMGTIKSHLHRARAEMAAFVSAAGWGPGARD